MRSTWRAAHGRRNGWPTAVMLAALAGAAVLGLLACGGSASSGGRPRRTSGSVRSGSPEPPTASSDVTPLRTGV